MTTPTSDTLRSAPLCALVVDDSEHMRRSVQMLLSMDNFQSRVAKDGYDALQQIADGCFDLLVTDLEMPGMGGLELLKWIHENRPSLPVILMSGALTSQVEHAARDYGAAAFLRKPFGRRELSEALESSQRLHRDPP